MMKAIIILSMVALGSAIAPRSLWGGPVLAVAPQPLLADPLAKPTPYAFGFDVTDEYGTTLQRQESGDGSGAVKGSYSYKDGQGLTRVVDYVADAGGFRANVNTNEPGTETSAPADVTINAKPVLVAVAPKLVARPVLALRQKIY